MKKVLKLIFGFISPVPCFTSLYLFIFGVNISTLLFPLNGTMLRVVVFGWGWDSHETTCSESKNGTQKHKCHTPSYWVTGHMNVSLSFLSYLFPLWRTIFQNLANMWPDFVRFPPLKYLQLLYMLFHTSVINLFIKLSLKKLTNSINHSKG